MKKYKIKQSTGHLLIGIVCLVIGLFLTFYSISLGTPADCKYIPIQFKENCDKIPLDVKQQALIPSSLLIGSIFFLPSLFELKNWRKELKNEIHDRHGVEQ